MFSTDWQTSPRHYDIVIERDRRVPVADGVTLDCDIFRPDAPGRFPVILAAHPYSKPAQSQPMLPEAFSYARAVMEAGDTNFYVRRGYVYVILNIRGTGASDGVFSNRNPDDQSIRDLYHAVEWLAVQDWADGNVGMFGVSYFSVVQKRLAALRPPHLKTIFAMYGWTDGYRDLFYHGGIFAYGFFTTWLKNRGAGMRIEKDLRAELGAEAYERALAALRADAELQAVPMLAEVLAEPEVAPRPLLIEVLMHALDDDYHRARAVDFSDPDPIPAYFGADWGMFGFHMPGDVRAFQSWKGVRRLTMGPPIYLDRPVYQYAYESLRWFDHWLKGIDTGILDEPPVKLFIVGANEWKHADDWPVPGTRWTPFYLHDGGWLSEREPWVEDGRSTYDDAPGARGGVVFTTPKIVENTEICGPIALNLYAGSSDREAFWFASLWLVGEDGAEQMLTRGWLRGSQRALDEANSKPWQPRHRHDARQALDPGAVYLFSIEIRPYGILLKAGQRLRLKIRSADDETPTNYNELLASGHLSNPRASTLTIHHNPKHPSHLLLPVTRGNIVGTYFSGGERKPV
jgi:hypothetical protein